MKQWLWPPQKNPGYALGVNPRAFDATGGMVIDEERQIKTISDHNVIVRRCQMEYDPYLDSRREKCIMKSQRAAVGVERELTGRVDNGIWTYTEFIGEIQGAIKQATRWLELETHGYSTRKK